MSLTQMNFPVSLPTTDHRDLIIHLTRLGKLDAFLNPVPRPSNPNDAALSRIVPPPMPRAARRRAILRMERMQRDLSPTHNSMEAGQVRRIA